jgi:hypothetical protein
MAEDLQNVNGSEHLCAQNATRTHTPWLKDLLVFEIIPKFCCPVTVARQSTPVAMASEFSTYLPSSQSTASLPSSNQLLFQWLEGCLSLQCQT